LDAFLRSAEPGGAQAARVEVLAAAFHFDEGEDVVPHLQPVVDGLVLGAVFGGDLVVLVVAQPVAEEVGDQQPGVAFVGVPVDEVLQGPGEPLQRCVELAADVGFPLRERGFGAGEFSGPGQYLSRVRVH